MKRAINKEDAEVKKQKLEFQEEEILKLMRAASKASEQTVWKNLSKVKGMFEGGGSISGPGVVQTFNPGERKIDLFFETQKHTSLFSCAVQYGLGNFLEFFFEKLESVKRISEAQVKVIQEAFVDSIGKEEVFSIFLKHSKDKFGGNRFNLISEKTLVEAAKNQNPVFLEKLLENNKGVGYGAPKALLFASQNLNIPLKLLNELISDYTLDYVHKNGTVIFEVVSNDSISRVKFLILKGAKILQEFQGEWITKRETILELLMRKAIALKGKFKWADNWDEEQEQKASFSVVVTDPRGGTYSRLYLEVSSFEEQRANTKELLTTLKLLLDKGVSEEPLCSLDKFTDPKLKAQALFILNSLTALGHVFDTKVNKDFVYQYTRWRIDNLPEVIKALFNDHSLHKDNNEILKRSFKLAIAMTKITQELYDKLDPEDRKDIGATKLYSVIETIRKQFKSDANAYKVLLIVNKGCPGYEHYKEREILEQDLSVYVTKEGRVTDIFKEVLSMIFIDSIFGRDSKNHPKKPYKNESTGFFYEHSKLPEHQPDEVAMQIDGDLELWQVLHKGFVGIAGDLGQLDNIDYLIETDPALKI